MKPVLNFLLIAFCTTWLICVGIPVVSLVSLILWDYKYTDNMWNTIIEIIES